MIMQSYDFYMLYQKYGCNMQFGGDDQWSNMLGGTELIRRKLGKDAYAMTITLLLNSEGKKMGKTQSGAVWLDPNKTSPFDFYQYWRNVDDADVIKCMRLLTFLPIGRSTRWQKWEGSQLNKAKEILAYELTKSGSWRRGSKESAGRRKSTFSGGADTAHMPTTELDRRRLLRRRNNRPDLHACKSRNGSNPFLKDVVPSNRAVFPLTEKRSQMTSNTRCQKQPYR